MAAEMMSLDHILSQWGDAPMEEFVPCASYYEAMDIVLYLQEDVSYRADRVDEFLTLLWHPQQDRAVGVKLKGWKHLFHRLQRTLGAMGLEVPDSHFVPLTAAIEVAVTAGIGKVFTEDTERQRIQEKYEKAIEIVGAVKVDSRDVAIAA